MKLSTFAMAVGLVVTASGAAFAAPLSSVMDISSATDIRIITTAQTGAIDGSRAAAVAGVNVVELKHVGFPTNPALEAELEDDGLEMADVVKLYSDVNGVVWAFVAEPHEEEERRVAVTVATDAL